MAAGGGVVPTASRRTRSGDSNPGASFSRKPYPALAALADRKILREIASVFELRPIGPGAVGREFGDQDVVGAAEDGARRKKRRGRTRPQGAAARRRPAQHEGQRVDLIEEHDGSRRVTAVL